MCLCASGGLEDMAASSSGGRKMLQFGTFFFPSESAAAAAAAAAASGNSFFPSDAAAAAAAAAAALGNEFFPGLFPSMLPHDCLHALMLHANRMPEYSLLQHHAVTVRGLCRLSQQLQDAAIWPQLRNAFLYGAPLPVTQNSSRA